MFQGFSVNYTIRKKIYHKYISIIIYNNYNVI